MLTHRAIRRDYDEAGSVNALLALWAFVDDGTFVTKAGDVGVVYRLQGQDYEGLDHAQRRQVVHRFEAALRLLGERSFLSHHRGEGDAAEAGSERVDELAARGGPQGTVTSAGKWRGGGHWLRK